MSQQILTYEDMFSALVYTDVADRFVAIQKDGNSMVRIDYHNGYQKFFSPRPIRLVPNPAGYMAEQLSINCFDNGIHLAVAAECGKIQAMIGSAEDEPKQVNLVKFSDGLKRIGDLLEKDRRLREIA